MRLEHKFVVPAAVEDAWAAFNDLERVVPCFPGATLTSYEGDDFTGSVRVKLGPISLQYTGNGTFVERDAAARHAVIEAKGKDRRGNGSAVAKVTAQLSAAGSTSTEVVVGTDLTITGRPAQFGRGLIQEVSNKLLDEFTACLVTRLETPAEPAPPAAPAAAAPAAAPTPPASAEDVTSPDRPAPPADFASTSRSTGEPEPETVAEASLNLGTAVLPVLVRRARPYIIGAVVALILRRLLRR